MLEKISSHRFLISLIMLLVFHLLGLSLLRNFSIGIVALVVLADKELFKKLKALPQNPTFLIFFLLFFSYGFSLFYSSDFNAGWKALETKLSLLFFPIIFSLGKLNQKEFRVFLKITLFLIVVLPIFGFIHQYIEFQEVGDTGLFYNDNLVLLFTKQAVFYAFFVNFGLLILIYLLEKDQFKASLGKVLAISSFLILICTQYLLASRTSMLMMLLIVIIYLSKLIYSKLNKLQSIVSVAVFIFILIGLITAFPKVLNRFESITNLEYRFDNPNPINHFNGVIKKENWNGLNTRLALWNCSIEKIKESPVLGYGIGDVQAELVEKYQEKNFILALKSNYNTHNQYLDILMSSGLIGLAIFLFSIIYLIVVSFQTRNWLLTSLLLILCVAIITENFFNREQGLVFVSLFTSLFSSQYRLLVDS